MVGLEAPRGLWTGSGLEDPIPCSWSRSRLLSDWGRRGRKSWQHPALGTLVTMETESLDCSVNVERAATSQEGSEEPHYQGLLPAGLRWGGHRVTGLPPHPILGASVNWLLLHPSWSSPGREWFQRADAHAAGEEDLGKGAPEGRGGFHTDLGAAAILTPACLRSQLKNHQQHICFNPWSPVT